MVPSGGGGGGGGLGQALVTKSAPYQCPCVLA